MKNRKFDFREFVEGLDTAHIICIIYWCIFVVGVLGVLYSIFIDKAL